MEESPLGFGHVAILEMKPDYKFEVVEVVDKEDSSVVEEIEVVLLPLYHYCS